MKKKILSIIISCFAICLLLFSITACSNTNAIEGQYYASGNESEYISIDRVNSETDGIFSVHDLTLSSYNISNHTEYNIKYEIVRSNGNLYYFTTVIDGYIVSGNINVSSYVITIGTKKYTK